MSPVRHLYFHIPFCPKLCPYCCFYVEVGAKNKNSAFVQALLGEVRAAKEKYNLQPETIYLGGGTPTSLLEPQLDELLGGLRTLLDFSTVREFTIEVNPATVRPSKAALLRTHGVNRASLGVQSWDDSILKTLGRVHTAAAAEKTYGILREAGIPQINVDLMFSVPGQSQAAWLATLEKTTALAPDHVSAYCLTYEEDTEFLRKLAGGEFVQNIEHDARLFELTMDILAAAGLAQYEISNYARPGCESAHNRACWLGADYLGFGPGAFSTRGLERWENIRDTAAYVEKIAHSESTIGFREPLAPAQRRGEILAFQIRTREGIHHTELAHRATETSRLESHGLLERAGDYFRLTRRGKLLADSVAEAFVE